MAEDLWTDFEPSVKQVADGFLLLRDEFKRLAERYRRLEGQHERLKTSLPSESTPLASAHVEDNVETPVNASKRSLNDWLEDILGKEGSETQANRVRIKQAEFASFKVQTQLEQLRSNRNRARRSSQELEDNLGRQKNGQRRALEIDFTTTRRPGQLGCPFSTPDTRGLVPHSVYTAQKYNLPTPRSSGSNFLAAGPPQSLRHSYNDPIKSESHKAENQSVNTASGQGSAKGPVCPIRFLDQHDPEEVSKYFQDHKHELPESHEQCIKRFANNAEDVKQLDAKYGNLVTMIQGLGQKHQPMLPEEPILEDLLADDGRTRSNAKIEKWAEVVEESNAEEPTQVFGKVVNESEDRTSHFERPLREVRVGESPSRPWGEPIPSKYLDRQQNDSASSVAVQVDPLEEQRPSLVNSVRQETDAQKKAQSKCPFDPRNLASGPHKDTVDADRTPTKPKERHNGESKTNPSTSLTAADNIVNNGIVMLSGSVDGKISSLKNDGILLIGYSENLVAALLKDKIMELPKMDPH